MLVHLELVNMRDAGPTNDEFSAPQHIHNTQHQHIPPRTGTAIVIRSAAGDDNRQSTSTDKVRVRVAGGGDKSRVCNSSATKAVGPPLSRSEFDGNGDERAPVCKQDHRLRHRLRACICRKRRVSRKCFIYVNVAGSMLRDVDNVIAKGVQGHYVPPCVDLSDAKDRIEHGIHLHAINGARLLAVVSAVSRVVKHAHTVKRGGKCLQGCPEQQRRRRTHRSLDCFQPGCAHIVDAEGTAHGFDGGG
eukprot:scaffold590_cov75-Phaeocystis_antarctica.AAC.2